MRASPGTAIARLAVWVGLLACASQAQGQQPRPESLRLYGGTYSPECGSPRAPRLHIGADALVIEQGGKRRVATGVMDVFASFGAAPTSAVPEGFVVEFMSDEFSFHVFEDADGFYIRPATYLPQARPVIGPGAMGQRFGRCP